VLRDNDGILAAAIRYWPAEIVTSKGNEDVLLLGPVAVHPTRQGEGLGGLLINESLAESRRLGWERVLLVGDAPYYGRFGFSKLNHVEMPPPTNPDRILGLALKAGAWDGITGRVVRATVPI
jgi:predicted N-acetyltransferase YhbS